MAITALLMVQTDFIPNRHYRYNIAKHLGDVLYAILAVNMVVISVDQVWQVIRTMCRYIHTQSLMMMHKRELLEKFRRLAEQAEQANKEKRLRLAMLKKMRA